MAGVPSVLVRRPRQRRVIDRPRLVDSPMGLLTVISGPTGSGKTVLAGQLADEADDVRVGWCRLAPGWNQPADIVALAHAALGVDDLEAAPTDVFDAAGRLLDLLETEPSVLVVEDLHLADDGECERLLAEVAALLPEHVAIIVTSVLRPAELVSLLASGTVRVVTGGDLAFDRSEADALLDATGPGVAIADDVLEALAGSASGLVALVSGASRDATSIDAVLADALHPSQLGDLADLHAAASVLPYVTVEIANALGLGDRDRLQRFGEHSSFVVETAGAWRLTEAAAAHLRARVPDDVATAHRIGAADVLAGDDPAAAIELLIDADRFDDAGDLLASHASHFGADRATRWLYRLPADVRRRMPPVLSGGRATVNVSLAMMSAREQLERATDDDALVEAHLGLGSLELAAGDLAEAAATLEAGLRLAGAGHPASTSLAELLAHARWFAGDSIGARVVVDDLDQLAWAQILAALIAIDEGNSASAARALEYASAVADDAEQAAVDAVAALASRSFGGVDESAAELAAAAYGSALSSNGRELATAGFVHGLMLVERGEAEQARTVAEQIERTVGRHDHGAKLMAALVRRGASRMDGHADAERDGRRVADLRVKGYAALERIADSVGSAPDDLTAVALEVRLLGRFGLVVDGVEMGVDAWKSRKALEVCAYLAQSGELGASREQVIEAVWPNRDPEKGRTLLRTALSQVRRVLEPKRAAGQESRFVSASGDRIVVAGTTDVSRAAAAAEAGDHGRCFDLVVHGVAPDAPDVDWLDELRSVVERLVVESATRVAADGSAAPDRLPSALEALIRAEPWNKDHFDALIAHHRSVGDDESAADVERRWFADD